MICPQCGREIPDAARFCPRCGALAEVGAGSSQDADAQSRPEGSREPKRGHVKTVLIVVAAATVALFAVAFCALGLGGGDSTDRGTQATGSEEASAPEEETTEEETPEEGTPEEEAEDDDSAELLAAYQAYIDLLTAERSTIDGYWYPPAVSLCDVYGDDLPELVYVKVANQYLSTLEIVTFEDGATKTVYSGDWDYMAASGLNYCLFQVSGEKALYASEDYGDAYWETDYVRFTESGGALAPETVCTHLINEEYFYESDPSASAEEYTVGGAEATEAEFNAAEAQLLDNMENVIMRKQGDSDDRGSAMTCSEMIAYLQSLLS